MSFSVICIVVKVAQKHFQIVWSKVHESTEKTLTGKKGSFYLTWTCLIVHDTLQVKMPPILALVV